MLSQPDGRDATGLAAEDLDLIASRYWDHYRLAGSQIRAERLRAKEPTSPEYVAWERVHNAVLDGTPGIGAVLRRLADTVPNNDEIAYLGAGHLEDLVNEQPEIFATEVLPLANSSVNLRKACRSIDPDDSVPERVVAGLLAATIEATP